MKDLTGYDIKQEEYIAYTCPLCGDRIPWNMMNGNNTMCRECERWENRMEVSHYE